MEYPWKSASRRTCALPFLLSVSLGLGWYRPVAASDEFTGAERVLARQCAALVEGDVERLRKLLDGKPLHALTTRCPGYPPVRFADLATENLTYDKWLKFRELAAPEERAPLSDLRLRFVLGALVRLDEVKPGLDRIDQMMDEGASPRGEDGKVSWTGVADLLDVLQMPESKATAEDKAHVARIFLDRMLARLPAERDADLAPLWNGLVHLPEPELLKAVALLKERFGGFSPSRETWQAAPETAYPLQSAAPFSFREQPPLSDAAVLAIVDLRLPAPPTLSTWTGAVDQGRLTVLDAFIHRGYPLPQEQESGTWRSILVSGVAAIDARSDTRPLEKMLAVAKREDLRPEIADRMVLMLAFARPKVPSSDWPAKRWQLMDRLVALGADPNRAFNDKAEVRMHLDLYNLVRRDPEVATGLLDHGLSPTAPVLPSGGNLLNNYLMVKRPVPEPEPELGVIRDMLKRKNIINTFDPGVNRFPVELAVMNHSPEFAKAFLALGVNIHARDPNGYGLLVRAAANGYAKLVKFLLDAGADANEATPDGISPLAYAECAKNAEVIQLLQQHGGIAKGTPDCGGRQ